MRSRVPAGWVHRYDVSAIFEQSERICLFKKGEYAVSPVCKTVGDGLHPLLLQQPDQQEQKLYQGITEKIAHGSLHTGRVAFDVLDQEESRLNWSGRKE